MSDHGFKGTYALSNDSTLEDSVKSAGAPATNLSDVKLDILMGMFVKFQDSVELQQSKTTHEMAEMKIELGSIRSPASFSQHDQTTFPDRQSDNRRTSMFLGSPLSNNSDQSTDHIKPQIAFIQSQVVYDVELKVSSLSGLRFLFQQQQRLATKYPHSEILISHMVSFPLRQNVLATYNSRRYDQFIRNGEEPEELMCEKWLTFDNKLVLEILVEACRPRTREQCAKEFIMFLSIAIPQKFKVNADNFSRDFYEPMMKSLHDLDHLSALFMKDSSIRTQNKATVPVEGFGTRDNPGLIQVWILSLGIQKDAFLQLLGRDELQRFKTLQPAIKYIRYRLMDVRNQSEVKHDLDSRLTPVKYDDLHRGESFTRQQTDFVPRHQYASPSPFRTDRNQPTRYQPTKPSLAVLNTYPKNPYQDDEDDENSMYEHFEDNEEDLSVTYADTQENPPDSTDPEYKTQYEPTLISMGDVRSAIFSTYRGYCSELFVFGSCSKLQSGCKFDHSAATLELCIKSFTLLSKRDLLQHGSLPPPPLRHTPPAGHNNPYNSNRTYTPTVKPNGPLTHPARSPGFTVLPRTTGQPYQSRSHAP